MEAACSSRAGRAAGGLAPARVPACKGTGQKHGCASGCSRLQAPDGMAMLNSAWTVRLGSRARHLGTRQRGTSEAHATLPCLNLNTGGSEPASPGTQGRHCPCNGVWIVTLDITSSQGQATAPENWAHEAFPPAGRPGQRRSAKGTSGYVSHAAAAALLQSHLLQSIQPTARSCTSIASCPSSPAASRAMKVLALAVLLAAATAASATIVLPAVTPQAE